MNERLLDICIKAGINTWPFNEVGFISLDESELVKFAELIVKECASVCHTHGWGMLEHGMSGHNIADDCGTLIKEHFGVEE